MYLLISDMKIFESITSLDINVSNNCNTHDMCRGDWSAAARRCACLMFNVPSPPPLTPPPQENEGRMTLVLLFSITIACIGNPFLYGYQIGVINQPAEASICSQSM